ncbi:BgTH12-06124 [Blumeria graminis f. sp. triticale]|uniref:Negative regulatory subunit of the protein phosphatase n=4 Tax=Blumeria graminis TaxID=34373 RepID=A0A656KGS4_BLUGR|nr:Negative regulatory subunit of the protein phosphatase [Blumeria graminis f. sp. tritici 96224]CAD6504394.1 BgTH12-06124 [Blumeria graminis f. sp. triticale]VDB91225.1 Bgt-768 [Blumeria graminis f. sp. tritici]
MADPDDIISASLSKSQFQRFCLPKVDTGINESRKFRVIIASTGPNDVSQVQELFLRLSKNSRIETSVIIDEFLLEHDFPKDTTVLRNLYFRKFEFRDKACEVVELAEIELARQRAYELCQWADLMILAPIDYDNLAKMLCGITDCFLLEILRGWNISKSILLAPGMTISMWENPMTKKQLKKVQRIMQKVQIISPILWTYDEKSPSKKLLPWNGMNEFIEIVESQVLSALMKIVNDTDILATSTPTSFRIFTKSKASLPAEIWSLIFERVGDWEISKALDIYTNGSLHAVTRKDHTYIFHQKNQTKITRDARKYQVAVETFRKFDH